MKAAIRPLLSATLLLSSLWSCTEHEIEREFVPEPSRLVIYGVLHPGDTLLSVWISRTRPVNDTRSPLPVLNATARLSQNGQSPTTLSLRNPDEGHYSVAVAPQPGSWYELEVAAPGFSPVRTQTQVPEPIRHSVVHQVAAINEPPEGCSGCSPYVVRYQLEATLADPPGQENYYEVASAMQYFRQDTGYTAPTFEVLDTITNEGTYRLDVATDDPLFFRGYETDEVIRDQQLTFSDRLFDGQTQTFRYQTRHEARQKFRSTMRESYHLLSLLRTLHPDLHHYQRGISSHTGLNNLPFAEPTSVSGNVEGGYGIFSSYSEDTVFIGVEPPGD